MSCEFTFFALKLDEELKVMVRHADEPIGARRDQIT
jgi:hypothetical protein